MSNAPPSRDRRSLQDLAKLANSPTLGGAAKTPPPPAVKTPPPPSVKPPAVSSGELEHDSGIVDLKTIAQADEGAEERAKSTPLASAPLFDEETPSRPPPAGPSSGALSGSAQPPSASGQRAKASAVAAVAAPAEKKGPVMWIVGVLALGAVVAGGLFLRASSQQTAAVAPPPPEPTASAPGAAAPTPPPAAVAATTPAASEPAASAAPAAAPEPEPAPNAEPTLGHAAGGHVALRRGSVGGKAPAGASGGSTVSGLSSMMAQATATPAADTSPPPPAAAGALGDSMQHAVGATGASKTATDTAPAAPHYAPGSVPDKPSQGAVTSALGAVLSGARDCLNPDDPISHAHITFSSSGSVSAVSVTGHAAGRPAEGCIKSALLKASIPPFAEGTFGATVTIRPN